MEKVFKIYSVLVVILFVLAFIFGPRSCNGGLTVYFDYGIVFLVVALFLPFFVENRAKSRLLFSLGLIFLTLLLWIIGLFAGDFRIMCKLF